MNKKVKSAIAVALCGALSLTVALPLAACGGGKDSIVLMMEEPTGLFNPFYATAGADMDVVGLTQISMLSTDNQGYPVAGEDYATVALDFEEQTRTSGNTTYTDYYFVIKNGLKFSDGVPLTMNDVMFNIYEYLDPVYTGSSTMYSTDILGLTAYRTQTNYSDNSQAESQITNEANASAQLRILELIDIYELNNTLDSDTSFSLDEAGMRAAINEWTVSDGYKDAVANRFVQQRWGDADYRAQLLADYNYVLETFKEELESDWSSAQESYDTTTAPYNEWTEELSNPIFRFFLYEGYITPEYEIVQGVENENKILGFNGTDAVTAYPTRDDAINRVYNDTVTSGFNQILTAWGTAGTAQTQFAADARGIIIRNRMPSEDELLYDYIEGIVSLGHPRDGQDSVNSVTINGKTYAVAHEHNEDGTPANGNEYDVLRITVEGTDPKAIYNFGFTVAPAHYYTADSANPNGREIDIANNEFGVEYASSDFQTDVIQSLEHLEKPIGAGAYKITNRENEDNPAGDEFYNANICYYKANDNFMFEVKTEKLRMQYVNASDALDSLESGAIDYAEPQFTQVNATKVSQMVSTGKFESLDAWQLGYGYIGINAGKVPNVYIRRAIMSAMQTSLSLQYYQTGQAQVIDWPMSRESWAYPFEADGQTSKANGHDYTMWTSRSAAETKVQEYMRQAGVSAGDPSLSITFTIAGSSISEHPCYNVFIQAMDILKNLGWDIEVTADSQALTKLATGSLEVWAAAWGSTIDPDMYQVYHKNSNATSVYAWGYREILSNTSLYSYENPIINQLSELIDDGRETMDRPTRKGIYEKAMSLVLDLAVELPVYQRKNLYVYNSSTVTGFTTIIDTTTGAESVNPFTSPIDRIWELELVG